MNDYTISRSLQIRALHLTSSDSAFLAMLLRDYQDNMRKVKDDSLYPPYSTDYIQREINDASRLEKLLSGE